MEDRQKDEKSRNLFTNIIANLDKLVRKHLEEERGVLLPLVNRHLGPDIGESLSLAHEEILQGLQRLDIKLNHIDCLNGQQSAFKGAVEFDSIIRKRFSQEENVIYWFLSVAIR